MIVKLKVIPRAKKVKIVDEGSYLKVYLTSEPRKGKANEELLEILAEYFGVRKNKIKIIRGETRREKIVEIFR
ncbi:MAG TPA: DUF167 domain-containing protein [Candidatus Altiarchaeales archaeon]|nr:MAG: DUF167 domain-containing protein [Candidatus Altiarchaeales archaeon]HDN83660.1 DUF167 domain-containing protein [Candidatus Altiarchaeales archaeon]